MQNPMSDIGVIGLGVMGRNLILNMVDHGIKVSIYNRTHSKTVDLVKECPVLSGFKNIEDFINSLSTPRKILLMVPSGEVVDKFLETLTKLVEKEDIIIDGGNSFYKDTIRRYNSINCNYVGCGISGGEYGARNGPAMFIGCKSLVYDVISPLFNKICAKFKGKSCLGYMGDNGAGHFVKIVHNGIEYSEMQVLQEIFNISCTFNEGFDVEVFNQLNSSRSKGYLVEICEKILKKRNDKGRILDVILDKAEQKGTGKMCIYSAIDTDTQINSIVESVFSRYMSSEKEKRIDFANSFTMFKTEEALNKNIDKFSFEKAFYLCKAINYIQGCNLLIKNRRVHNWSYDISLVCDSWRDGCILRSDFLDVLKLMSSSIHLETSPMFIAIVEECYDSLKEICLYSIKNDIYSPVLHSCLSWISGLKMDRKNGNLIQAMRDYFGRHGVTLEDGSSTNIEWD